MSLLSFISLLLPLLVQAPALSFPQVTEFEQVDSRGITYTLFQDDRGMMWAGTHNSLLRFDGWGFKPFVCMDDQGRDVSLASGVNAALRISDNLYLLGTSDGVVEFDVRHSRAVGQPVLQGRDVRSLIRFTDGALMAATASGVFLCRGGSVMPLDGMGGSQLGYQLVECGDGKILVCSYAGLFSYDPSDGSIRTITMPAGHSDGALSACRDTARGCTWVGTHQSLFRLPDGAYALETASSAPEATYKTLLLSRDGLIWAGTENGLVQFDPDGLSCRIFRHQAKDHTSLRNNVVWSLCEDRDGSVWVGTNRGISVLRRDSGLQRYAWGDIFSTSEETNVTALAVDRDGCLWIGGEGGVGRYDGKRALWFREEDPHHYINKNMVRDISVDADGDVWLATDDGIDIFDRRSGTFVNKLLVDKYFSNWAHWCYGIMDDGCGNMWVSSYDGGVSVVGRGRLKTSSARAVAADTTYCIASGKPDGSVKMTLKDSSGCVWALLIKSGLARIFDGNVSVIRRLCGRDICPSSIVRSANGCLWVSVQGGLVLLDTGTMQGTFTEISTPTPLMPLFEKDGTLWALASDRIVSVGRQGVSTMLLDAPGYICGIPYGENHVLIGGMGGVALVSSQAVERVRHPVVHISSIRAGGEPVRPGGAYEGRRMLEEDVDFADGITVPWNRRLLDIDVFCPSSCPLQYCIHGSGEDWVPLSKTPLTLYIHGLRAGRHTICFRSQEDSAVLREFNVRVLAPWYATWYMILLYIALAVTIIALAVMLVVTKGHLRIETAQKDFYIRQSELNEAQLETLRKVSAPKNPDDSSETKLIKSLSEYVYDHMDESDISVQTLSEVMKLPPKQLYRKVKAATGLTVVEYVRGLRLQRAAELLRGGGLNVTETMYKVGFSNLSYFTKCFIGLYGVSPKKYREE